MEGVFFEEGAQSSELSKRGCGIGESPCMIQQIPSADS